MPEITDDDFKTLLNNPQVIETLSYIIKDTKGLETLQKQMAKLIEIKKGELNELHEIKKRIDQRLEDKKQEIIVHNREMNLYHRLEEIAKRDKNFHGYT